MILIISKIDKAHLLDLQAPKILKRSDVLVTFYNA